MLSTGNTNDNYIEEYVALKVENGEYKLNINSYLGRNTINKKERAPSIGRGPFEGNVNGPY